MGKIKYIIAGLVILVIVGACGPKPEVISENLTPQELGEEPISPVAFQYYISGVIAELEENYELALNYYSNALRYSPDSYDIRVAIANIRMGMRDFTAAWDALAPLEDIYSESVLMKADVQRSLGNWDQAEHYYQLAKRLNPTEIAPYWYLGNYYRQTGQYSKAIPNYEKLVRLNGSSQIINDLGSLYIEAGDTANAIKTYEHSIESDPSVENHDGFLALARLLNSAGQPDSSQAVLNNYIKISSGSIDARMQLVETYIKNDQKEEAIKEIESLANEYPNRSRLLGQLGAMSAELNEVELAKKLFTKQADLDQTDFFPHYYLGRIALYENKLEDAKVEFWKVIDLVDSLPDGWINLAEIYRTQDSLDMSIDVMRQAMDRVTIGKPDIEGYLARYYSQKEQYQAAINVLNGIVDSTTTDIGLLFTYASAFERVGDFNQSVANFERILKLSPDFHPALNYLGYMFADSGIYLPRAKDLIEKALAQDSTNPAYLDSYGWVLFKMGKLGEAEKYIRQALDLMDNPDVELYDHLAEIYYAQGRQEDARQIWQKALGMDPNNVAIREKLER